MISFYEYVRETVFEQFCSDIGAMTQIFILLIFLIICLLVTLVNSKSQYVQPLNMGLQMAIPYDIANIFIRPIAGVTSGVLSIGVALIILFGVITSPFGYFFGIPSRNYVMGGNPSVEPTSRMFDQVPEFDIDPFLLIPKEFSSYSCQLLLVCVAHGTLSQKQFINMYRFFSKHLRNIDAAYHEAIVIGFENNSLCQAKYPDCDKTVFSIIINTIINLLPNRSRRKTKTKIVT